MPRTDIHLEAMLRHLGAAYYESLHGRATRADVTRALDTVEEHLNGQAQRPSSGLAGSDRHQAHQGTVGHDGDESRYSHGWSRKVSDVMTTAVVTVDRITPYKEIARLLAVHRVSGLPVVKMGREVVGVVTEADLLDAQTTTARRLRAGARRPWWPHGTRHPALVAGELMTTPAVTIGPDATIPAAARLMSTHHLRRLPVTDNSGQIIGIVSRRDLLSVFLRPDEEIEADIRTLLDEVLSAVPEGAGVTVRDGIVTLTAPPAPDIGPYESLIPLAMRLVWNVDGVVDVVNRLGQAPAGQPAG